MMRVLFLTPSDGRYGFALAGFEQQVVDGAEVLAVVRAALADEQTGLVVVDERLLDAEAEERLRELDRHQRGVCVVLPAPTAETPAEDYAHRLLKRAIGYHVRLTP